MSTILSRLFFPEHCIGCGSYGKAICNHCITTIRLADESDMPHMMGLYDYGNKLVARSIRDLKYHKRSEAARALTHKAAPYINETIAELLQSTTQQTIILLPIPQHKHKTRSRGFNQSELIAQWFVKAIPGSTIKSLLRKSSVTIPQAHIKSRSLRLKNIAHSIEVAESLDPTQLYLIIDDVTTTGATFTEALRAMRASGARNIYCIALAHGYARR